MAAAEEVPDAGRGSLIEHEDAMTEGCQNKEMEGVDGSFNHQISGLCSGIRKGGYKKEGVALVTFTPTDSDTCLCIYSLHLLFPVDRRVFGWKGR